MTRLEEIRARCEAATPGPWEWRCSDNNPYSIEAEALTNVIYLEDDYPGYPECGEHLIMNIETSDAEFISHAREDIPYLLSQLAERDKELERYNVPLEEFKPELIKPYLSNTSSEYVCALEGEIERLMEAQRWIPVDEKSDDLPHDDGGQREVMCYFADGVMESFNLYRVRKWNEGRRKISRPDLITHFMPLPAAPEEGE